MFRKLFITLFLFVAVLAIASPVYATGRLRVVNRVERVVERFVFRDFVNRHFNAAILLPTQSLAIVNGGYGYAAPAQLVVPGYSGESQSLREEKERTQQERERTAQERLKTEAIRLQLQK